MKNKKKGFTLVELIVVITILAILGTIAFLSFQGYSSEARDVVRINDIKNIETGLELLSIKIGKYPSPDNSISYTGTSDVLFYQGEFGDNLTRMININKTPLDPVTQKKYAYSTTKYGEYYNVSTIKETGITSSIINNTYADNETSILKGNYRMDPSLPSLIVVPSSVTGSGIFDPNVCFVVDGGKNTVDKCVEKKNEMSLKNYDPNLVAYYDMETYYTGAYLSSPDRVYLKDLSGNNYDMVSGSSLTSTQTSSGSIFSSGGIIFDYNNFKYQFVTVSSSTGKAISPDKDLFVNNFSSSGGEIIPGMSFKLIVNYDKNENNINASENTIKRVLNFNKSNTDSNKDLGDFVKLSEGNILRLMQNKLETFISEYNDGLPSNKSVYGNFGCGNGNGIIYYLDDSCLSPYYQPDNILTSGDMFFYIIYNYKDKKEYIYGNGKLIYSLDITDDVISRIQEKGYKYTNFSLSAGSEGFFGKIYEVAIYDRALGENEIIQQTKIAGF